METQFRRIGSYTKLITKFPRFKRVLEMKNNGRLLFAGARECSMHRDLVFECSNKG